MTDTSLLHSVLKPGAHRVFYGITEHARSDPRNSPQGLRSKPGMVLLLAGLAFASGIGPAGGESIRSPYGISATADLPSPGLQAIRRAMLDGRRLPTSALRALADAGDGLAAFNLAKSLEAQGRADLAADIAHYYAMAVHTGRLFAVNRLIAMTDRGLASGAFEGRAARLRQIGLALDFAARHGNANAALRLSEAWESGDLFGKSDPAEAARYAGLAARNGDMTAASQLIATKALSGDGEGLQAAIEMVGGQADLGMQTLAQNLLRQNGSEQ